MKNFIIEKRVNPNDKWISYKKFNDLDTAMQSFNTLVKHRFSLLKLGDYEKYRIFDKVNKVYYNMEDK